MGRRFRPELLATNDNLVKLPDEVSFELRHGDGRQPHRLSRRHGGGWCKAGMKVGVIGLGGLGYIGARVARSRALKCMAPK